MNSCTSNESLSNDPHMTALTKEQSRQTSAATSCGGDDSGDISGGNLAGTLRVKLYQEWPRQTKPKKGEFMNFSRGIPEQKFNVNRACCPKAKHQNSQKWANFSFWPFLWFGLPGATPENCPETILATRR